MRMRHRKVACCSMRSRPALRESNRPGSPLSERRSAYTGDRACWSWEYRPTRLRYRGREFRRLLGDVPLPVHELEGESVERQSLPGDVVNRTAGVVLEARLEPAHDAQRREQHLAVANAVLTGGDQRFERLFRDHPAEV